MINFFYTLMASARFLTGSCSCAQGFLKFWSESIREVTINPWNSNWMLHYRVIERIPQKEVSSQCTNKEFFFITNLRIYKPNFLASFFQWSICLNQANSQNYSKFFLKSINKKGKRINSGKQTKQKYLLRYFKRD